MTKRIPPAGGIVYSTRQGRMCPRCEKAEAACICGRGAAGPAVPKDGVVRVSRETKGRGGKAVTLITGLPLVGPELAELARELKQRCGTGGTVRDGVVEIQGDHRDLLVTELGKRGWKVKKAGG